MLMRNIQVTEYLHLQQFKKGTVGYLGMETIPKKTSYLVPSLTLMEDVPDNEHVTERISYLLKQRAGSTGAMATMYKMYVHQFCEGTVQQ